MMTIMRCPDGHKEAVREQIVRVTAEALRRHGLSGVSIPALMKSAGLTHGGFYAHFATRDELVAEAIRAAASDTSRGTFAEVARGLLRLVEEKLRPARPARVPSDEALRLASTMVGAVVLGRLVDDPKLAERLLRAARDAVSP